MCKLARYYDPEDSRLLSQDTYRGENTDPATLNLYGYCAGNPINFTDPTGHWTKNIHEYITKRAINKTSLKNLKKGKRKELLNGCKHPDKKEAIAYKTKEWHGHAAKEKQETFWKEYKKSAGKNKAGKNKLVYFKLGTYLHSVQDWYAHSYIGYSKGDLENAYNNGKLPSETKRIYHADYTRYSKDMSTWVWSVEKEGKVIHNKYKDNVNQDWRNGKWKKVKMTNNKRYKKARDESADFIQNRFK